MPRACPRTRGTALLLLSATAASALAGCGLQPPGSRSERIVDAARDGDARELAELLEKHEPMAGTRGAGARSALQLAAGGGHEEAVRVLLANGADPNTRDREGITPLHAAASAGYADIVKMLLASGADVYADGHCRPDPVADAASDEIAALLREKALSVTVHPDGGYSVDGERISLESLTDLLTGRIERWPRDNDDRPTLEVRILAYADCEYRAIQLLMIECMRAQIHKLSFGAAKDDGGRGEAEEQGAAGAADVP